MWYRLSSHHQKLGTHCKAVCFDLSTDHQPLHINHTRTGSHTCREPLSRIQQLGYPVRVPIVYWTSASYDVAHPSLASHTRRSMAPFMISGLSVGSLSRRIYERLWSLITTRWLVLIWKIRLSLFPISSAYQENNVQLDCCFDLFSICRSSARCL